ncbi:MULTISPECIES: putative phage tail protein [Pelosinus]|uniref:DUF2313 domain-containing protein n=1 Tax=Pelosinus fermentans B4 TaxID=1149862 RepID=I9LHC8_9FIRM|nr:MULTISPECIES: putative phage tail protein [Pelosinus]EIW19904.1 Protein of unknown function DUF2313 [Pelosinus fermentans B4]EIW21239.1 hypothetical protein FA11_0966 [Pelosinus fermentans A11]
MIGNRALRMVNNGPDYYAYSKLYANLQQAIAADLDNVADKNEDVRLQLYIVTATWGLKYWESILGIPVVAADGYEARRSRILAKWRGIGNFGVDLLYALISAYTSVPVKASVDIENFVVIIEFGGDVPGYDDMAPQIQNVIHAHLGLLFKWQVKTAVSIKQDPKLTLYMTDSMNFWNLDGAGGKFLWNGAYQFDGSKKFDGLVPGHLAGSSFTQNHVITSYEENKTAKPFTEATQKWNSGFKFDGTRKFGNYAADTPSCGNSVYFKRVQAGVTVEKGAI